MVGTIVIGSASDMNLMIKRRYHSWEAGKKARLCLGPAQVELTRRESRRRVLLRTCPAWPVGPRPQPDRQLQAQART